MRTGRLFYPCAGNDTAAVPQTTRKVELAELDLISRAYRKPAAHVGLACWREVQVIDVELKGSCDTFLEEFRQPDPCRHPHRTADQIHASRAINRFVAPRITCQRQVQSVFVPVGLGALLLHVIFLPGRSVVIVVAREAGRHGHQISQRKVALPVVPVSERLVLRKKWINRCFRAEPEAAITRYTCQYGAVGFTSGTGFVCLLSGVTIEILLQDKLAVSSDQKTVDIDWIVLQIGIQDMLDERIDWARIKADIIERGCWPAVIGSIWLSIRVGCAAWSAREKAPRVSILAPCELQGRMRIQRGKGESVGRRIVGPKNPVVRLLSIRQCDLCAVYVHPVKASGKIIEVGIANERRD